MKQSAFTKKMMIDCLADLDSEHESYITLYLKPCSFPCRANDFVAKIDTLPGELKEALANEAVVRECGRYQTGIVVFWGQNRHRIIVIPPFAVFEDRVLRDGPNTSLLRQTLEKGRFLGMVLVAWGSYALGVFRDDRLMRSKIGTGYIHKRHRKGGRSQKRFARRTEEQKKDFLRRVANRVDEEFRDCDFEQIFFGGNRLILKPLLEECPYLRIHVDRISKRFLNVRYADRQSLYLASEDVNESIVFSFDEDMS